ncbi:MAG: bifunctional oligoribonuclease/PAP phosphatase NrnA [bacterium]|nr:bifunctional oligoribonuclease/PAP phosphatase NrnA [bacterium]
MVKREETPTARAKELIVSSKHILLSLHRHPDGDSIASCLALYHYLKSLDKKVTVISPTEVKENYDFLPGYDKIKAGEFFDFKPAEFDLFIIPDSSSWGMLSDDEISPEHQRDWHTIGIDHHKTNLRFADINLVDEKSSSACEVLYDLFQAWGVTLNSDLALCLLTGMVTDTGGFHYPNTSAQTLKKASDLITKGADLRLVMFNFLRRVKISELHYWEPALRNLEIDKSGRYARIILSSADLKKIEGDRSYRESAAGLFLQIIDGTEFGYILTEDESGLIRGSLRARTDFDVSLIAVALDGGGHQGAAGFVLRDMTLNEAKEKIEKVIRKILS